MNGVNKSLITKKHEKIKKNVMDFHKGLGQSLLKFNDLEKISKKLTALIKH